MQQVKALFRDLMQKVRVLLVEDNPSDASLVEAIMEDVTSTDVQLTLCVTAQEATDRLRGERFDAILLDLDLPDSRGLDTVNRIKAAAGDMPIVVLSGHDDEAAAVEAVAHGVQDYVMKGTVDGPMMSRIIRYAIERKRSDAELRHLNETLEERVKQRTADLEQTVTRLGQAILEHERDAQEVKHVQERFYRMLDAMPVVFWIVSPDLSKVHFCNAAAERVWGISRESIYQNPDQWVDMIHAEDREAVHLVMQRWLFGRGWKERNEVTVSYRIIRPDGSVVRLAATGFALLDACGELEYIGGFSTPIETLAPDNQGRKHPGEGAGKLWQLLSRHRPSLEPRPALADAITRETKEEALEVGSGRDL